MISILIPTYNYDPYPLVKELYEQCKSLGISFEILVNDDASTETLNSTALEKLDSCSIFYQKENKGLSFSRNFLANKARYPWCIFLDSDTKPVKENFIANYIQHTSSGYDIINGGLMYELTPPKKDSLLRWKYGITREAMPIEKRLEPHHKSSFLSSNLLIKKSIFEVVSYDESLNKYGYEDLVFQKEINQKKFKVLQIDNPVYHLKLDTSEIFVNKFKQSLSNLNLLIVTQKLDYTDTKISKIYKRLNYPIIKHLIVFTFTIFENRMYNLLKSSKTSLFVFDLYRIGLFFKISTK